MAVKIKIINHKTTQITSYYGFFDKLSKILGRKRDRKQKYAAIFKFCLYKKDNYGIS